MIGSALEYCADNMEREAARLSGEDDANAFNPDWRSEFARRQLFSDSAGTGGIPMGGYASQNNRLLVLVSDGASGDLNGADAISQITDRLNGAGITMYHIHIGSDSIPNAVSTIAEETVFGDQFRRIEADLRSHRSNATGQICVNRFGSN